ncbi:RAMP superfamily CRISPR-associated protein [Azospirillum agricola]|uniref:RAMP superfamily CRISPR-associated protein n=1 Tax=Azospirillum agricola TaxID=1720247 RepID=UPI000A0EFFAE|nr:RAMP superfamily CRISPR-associated protein [Azospirillum agricola]SMH30342.1 CRISPR/Cas system CSM-associated protein Csm3, group 7 of RAMP superfamily [Azospirillum lipoferum]
MHKHHVELTGSLTVLSPLHMGNGQRGTREGLTIRTEQGEEKPVQLSEIQRDGRDFPYLPGTSLKGALRARLTGGTVEKLFGRLDDKTDGDGVMGRLWIYGAIHRNSAAAAGPQHSVVAARTRIDRASGTADDHKLFHADMVPPGTVFDFHARWLTDAEGAELDAELAQVATALAPLTDEAGIALGRGGRQGQGRVRLSELTATLVPWDGDPVAVTLPTLRWQPPGEVHRLRLTGDGPYMILDSARRAAKPEGAEEETNILHSLLDGAGHPALPGSTLLGALRARAAWLDGGADNRDRVYSPQEELSATERLFGVTGWRGLLGVESIRIVDPGVSQRFTSVKLDRFSAAPIDGALFTVEAFVDPVFEVTLSLTPRGNTPITDGARALFERLLRDIRDMGLMLGHGGSRGFGWFGVEPLSTASLDGSSSEATA